MIDTSKKSSAEIRLEKKEAELRELRKRESKWRQKQENVAKCMIGAAFLKHFPESLLFDQKEWDRIAGAAVMSKEFQGTVQTIKTEASGGKKPGSESTVLDTAKTVVGERKPVLQTMKPETAKETVNLRKPAPASIQPLNNSNDFFDEEDSDTDQDE